MEQERITSYEIAQTAMEQAPVLEITEELKTKLAQEIKQVTMNSSSDKYFMLMAPNISYCTLFANVNNEGHVGISKAIADFIIDEHESLGGLKDFSREEDRLEIWIGTTLYMLFGYDKGVEEF